MNPSSSHTLATMRLMWDGDPADTLAMVRALAPTMATEEDYGRKGRLSGLVQHALRQRTGQRLSLTDIADALALDLEHDAVALVLCLDMLVELGLVTENEQTWS